MSNILSPMTSGPERSIKFFHEKNGAPGKIRTPNLLIRSQTLYPIELRARGGGTVLKAMAHDK